MARALEHDKPSLSFRLACDHLRAEKIVRPGVTLLERLVMAARERGHRETFHRLASLFIKKRLAQPDSLLIREESLDLSYRQLAWCTTWYLREETLKPAIATIVNRHYRYPLARLWGGGTLSSSDGQRFPMAVRSQTATALPRYFGYGRGLTFYTWTSDQFSQYGSKPIPSTVRDATYVLDGILDNETELPIAEHTSDTGDIVKCCV